MTEPVMNPEKESDHPLNMMHPKYLKRKIEDGMEWVQSNHDGNGIQRRLKITLKLTVSKK